MPALIRALPGMLVWGLVLPLVAPVQAVESVVAKVVVRDRDAPLLFDAGQMKIDVKRRVRLLTGGVQLTRGTFMLSAQQVELRETPLGSDFAVATAGAGQPARFRQRREGMDEVIEGQADLIEYDSKSETVRLIGNALLKRLRGSVVTEEVSGQTVVYEHSRETFEVLGGSSGSRVKGVVTPFSKGTGESGR